MLHSPAPPGREYEQSRSHRGGTQQTETTAEDEKGRADAASLYCAASLASTGSL